MIYLSMNMYSQEDFADVFHFTKLFPALGIELFPLFHELGYEEILHRYEKELREHPISCHEQYYEADNSAELDSELFKNTEKFLEKTISACERLKSRHIVFHYNNGAVSEKIKEKTDMIERARKRLKYVIEKADAAGVSVLVENTGIPLYHNVLLDENEFIRECKDNGHKVLIDIGHVWCNHWNLSRVMKELRNQIAAYHIHNNDEIHDSHQRIHDGNGDFEQFTRDYLEYTPNADLILEYIYTQKHDVAGIEEDIKEMLSLQQNAFQKMNN